MNDDSVMTYKQFCHGYVRYKDAARRIVRGNIKGDMKWKRDADNFMNAVAESFFDRDRNFRRWLALEKCIFRNPMTDDYVAVSIGDDPEAVYYFLLFCKKINCREDIDEAFTEYLQYLINKSLEGGC